ncbi:ABC transporter permease subunit [Paenibacillus sacheonensis]|uniref:ABC transporter permease subunit n=2 Tax=Paenibacillus sacheonensis TaxID=742054 RepID=A0A7X5C4P8_9BACL|nr:ABC transporter permease subunit [Paenibacillus sacheonensis]
MQLIETRDHAMTSRSGRFKHLKQNGEMLLMTLPALLKIFIFSYIPIVGVIIAFKRFVPSKGIFHSPWNGLDNFEFFFKSQAAWTVLRNTIGLNLLMILIGTVVNVALAFLLYEVVNRTRLKAYQTVLFIPYFFSWVLVGLMLTSLLSPTSGLLTDLLHRVFGMEINFYANPSSWIWILTVVSVWKGAGFGSLIYYSVLMNIDRELFEAAEIDGASRLQTIWRVMLPFLIPMISVLTILALGNIIRADFGLFYFVPQNQSQLYPVTDVIDTYVYRALAKNGDFSMSAAIGLFQSVVGLVLILCTNKVAKSVNKDYSLF